MSRSQPNIIWLVWDTCREDFTMTEYRGKELTPNLFQLSQDSVTFSNAFSAAPWTPPSHASMFTGHYPSSHVYLNDGMKLKKPHIAELLSEQGYNTISISSGAKLASHTPLSNGFNEIIELFRLPYIPNSIEDFYMYYGKMIKYWTRFVPQYLLNRQKMGYLETSYIKNYIDATSDTESLFVFANYLTPHSPYQPVKPYQDWFDDSGDKVRNDIVDELSDRGGYRYMGEEIAVTEHEWEAVKARYAGEIAYVDSLLGHLISHLKKRNMYEDSMLIITSDHGEHFGEHNRAYHQFSLYDEVLHVPLVIKFPGNEFGGGEVSSIVSLTDIFPTISDIVGIQDMSSQGMSLYPPNYIDREYVFAEYGRPVNAINNLQKYTKTDVKKELLDHFDVSLQCVRSQNLKLIKDSKGRRKAFDLSFDSKEELNLLENSGNSEVIQPLEEAMEANLSELPKVRSQIPDDAEIKENLKALGYR